VCGTCTCCRCHSRLKIRAHFQCLCVRWSQSAVSSICYASSHRARIRGGDSDRRDCFTVTTIQNSEIGWLRLRRAAGACVVPRTRPPATRTCGRGQRGTPVQAVRGHAWGFTSTKRRRAAHHATMAGDPSGVPDGRTPAARHRFVLQRLQLASRVHERKPSRARVAQRRDAAWGSPTAVTLRLRQAHPWVRGVTSHDLLTGQVARCILSPPGPAGVL
jgi:hypothetical protein